MTAPNRPIRSQYEDFMRHVFEHGVQKGDRTGTGTRSVFGHQMRFDLSEGFPLLTTKKLHTRSIFGELLWFLRGSTNVGWLHDNQATSDAAPRPVPAPSMALVCVDSVAECTGPRTSLAPVPTGVSVAEA